jgi:hypothetical protein
MAASLMAAICLGVVFNAQAANEPSPEDLFNARIMPIFNSPNPSSCVQCHLSSVDLKDYILPSSEKTFASLRAQELVDVDAPEKSKILELINMREKDYDKKGAEMIHEKMRKAEYEAFASWIKACCADPRLRNLSAPKAGALAKPERPNEVIRHARKSRVVDSFVRNVWSHRMRCFPCHTPFEIDDDNPKHKLARTRLKKMEENMGIKFTSKLRLFRETPEATMQSWIEKSRDESPDRLPLINLEDATQSLIVLKPSSKLPKKKEGGGFEKPSAAIPVSHMGGIKMHKDDFSYKSFIAWIEDYGRVVGGEYTSVEDLPADNWHPSKHMVMLRGVPETWPKKTAVQIFVHEWDASTSAWKKDPIAFTQGSVAPRMNVFGALFLLRTKETEKSAEWAPEDPTLKPGKYLIKTYLDSKEKLAENPIAFLDDSDFAGQAEIQAHWGKLFKNSEKIDGSRLKK